MPYTCTVVICGFSTESIPSKIYFFTLGIGAIILFSANTYPSVFILCLFYFLSLLFNKNGSSKLHASHRENVFHTRSLLVRNHWHELCEQSFT